MRVTLPPNLTPEDRAIYDKYVEFMSEVMEGWQHPVENPQLDDTMMGNLLVNNVQVVSAAYRSGQRGEGTISSSPQIVASIPNEVRIDDCSMDQLNIHDYRGVVVSPPRTAATTYSAVPSRTENGWRMMSFWEDGRAC